jgi:hypothetical protein
MPYSDGLITQREPIHTGEVLQSVPAEGGNEVLRENDLQPQNFLSTAKGAYLAVRKLCQEVLARTTGTPALEHLLATRGLGQEAARAALEALTTRVLLKRFENPGFQVGRRRMVAKLSDGQCLVDALVGSFQILGCL